MSDFAQSEAQIQNELKEIDAKSKAAALRMQGIREEERRVPRFPNGRGGGGGRGGGRGRGGARGRGGRGGARGRHNNNNNNSGGNNVNARRPGAGAYGRDGKPRFYGLAQATKSRPKKRRKVDNGKAEGDDGHDSQSDDDEETITTTAPLMSVVERDDDEEEEDEDEDENVESGQEEEKPAAEEDKNDDEEGQVETASVAVAKDDDKPKRRVAKIFQADDVKKRSRRMFGSLIGILGGARKAQRDFEKSDIAKKRKRAEQNVEKRLLHQPEEVQRDFVKNSRKAVAKKRRAEQKLAQRLERLKQKKLNDLTIVRLTKQTTLLSKHCMTKTEPRLPYIPRKHTPKTKVLVELAKQFHADNLRKSIDDIRKHEEPVGEIEESEPSDDESNSDNNNNEDRRGRDGGRGRRVRGVRGGGRRAADSSSDGQEEAKPSRQRTGRRASRSDNNSSRRPRSRSPKKTADKKDDTDKPDEAKPVQEDTVQNEIAELDDAPDVMDDIMQAGDEAEVAEIANNDAEMAEPTNDDETNDQ